MHEMERLKTENGKNDHWWWDDRGTERGDSELTRSIQ